MKRVTYSTLKCFVEEVNNIANTSEHGYGYTVQAAYGDYRIVGFCKPNKSGGAYDTHPYRGTPSECITGFVEWLCAQPWCDDYTYRCVSDLAYDYL